MARVITPPPSKELERRIKCPSCDAIIGYRDRDIDMRFEGLRNQAYVSFIRCPSCRHQIEGALKYGR